MSRTVIHGLQGLRALAGTTHGPTEWITVGQDRVDAFAACTGDAQWIHIDAERAASSRFGGTLVHGFLTLALIPSLWHGYFDVRGIETAINAGLDRVRFPAPLIAGTRIRARFHIMEATESGNGLRLVDRVTIEAEGSAKPVCVADQIRFYRGAAS